MVESASVSDFMLEPDPARRSARMLIIARYGGDPPWAVSLDDCVALMLEFAADESRRANRAMDVAMDLLNCLPSVPCGNNLFIKSG
jgi:hypothetical protein